MPKKTKDPVISAVQSGPITGTPGESEDDQRWFGQTRIAIWTTMKTQTDIIARKQVAQQQWCAFVEQ